MLRAIESSSAPDITGTVMSTGSLPSARVTRNARSPLEVALPVAAMFHTPASGGAPWANGMAAASNAAATIAARVFMWASSEASSRARPGEFRGALLGQVERRARVMRPGLFALDLDVHVAHVGVDQFDGEVGLAFLLLDQDVF